MWEGCTGRRVPLGPEVGKSGSRVIAPLSGSPEVVYARVKTERGFIDCRCT